MSSSYPWAWLLYHALDLGISADDFWEMSARAIVNVQRQMIRTKKKEIERRQQQQEEAKRGPRLARIPRP